MRCRRHAGFPSFCRRSRTQRCQRCAAHSAHAFQKGSVHTAPNGSAKLTCGSVARCHSGLNSLTQFGRLLAWIFIACAAPPSLMPSASVLAALDGSVAVTSSAAVTRSGMLVPGISLIMTLMCPPGPRRGLRSHIFGKDGQSLRLSSSWISCKKNWIEQCLRSECGAGPQSALGSLLWRAAALKSELNAGLPFQSRSPRSETLIEARFEGCG